jgi:hypothetical protein
VFAEMDNKNISVNGSRCLISYVNVVFDSPLMSPRGVCVTSHISNPHYYVNHMFKRP